MFGRVTKLMTGELPAKAAAKFIAIEDEARDAQSITKGAREDHNAACNDYRFALRDFEDLKRRGNATNAEYVGAEQRLNGTREPMARTEDRLNRVKESADQPIGLRVNLEKWLESVGTYVLKDFTVAEPVRRKGESIGEAIERCRRVVRELRAEARNVRAAPVLSDEAKAVMRQYVDYLKQIGEPDLQYVIEFGRRRIDWPDRLVEVGPAFGVGQFSAPPALPAIAFQAWLQPDVFYAALCRQVDLEADDKVALSAADRFKRQSQIAADRLATEREEEFWIEQSRAGGVVIGRRPDADPRAVLGLASDLPAPKDSF